jgi:hypothetical protein
VSALAMMCSLEMTLTSFFDRTLLPPARSVLMPNNQEPVLHTCCFPK